MGIFDAVKTVGSWAVALLVIAIIIVLIIVISIISCIVKLLCLPCILARRAKANRQAEDNAPVGVLEVTEPPEGEDV